MGLMIRDVEHSQAAEGIEKALNTAQLLAEFEQVVQVAVGQAVERAAKYADTISKSMIQNTREAIAGIGKPKIMYFQDSTDKEPRKLTNPASKVLDRLVMNAKVGLHSLLVGPAGSGKTMAAAQLSEALNLDFYSVCFTAGASETWLFGRQTPNGFIEGPFWKAFKYGGVFLGDELDAADSNMLLCVNTALANGVLYNPMNGEQTKQHAKFIFVGGANTVGMGANATYTGRNRLDGATLTRFIKIRVDYDTDIEELVCPDEDLRAKLQRARSTLQKDKCDYIISTRCMDYAYRQKRSGIAVGEILQSLTLGWPEEIIRKCELDRWEEPKPKAKKKVAQLSGPTTTPTDNSTVVDTMDIF